MSSRETYCFLVLPYLKESAVKEITVFRPQTENRTRNPLKITLMNKAVSLNF